LHKEVEIPYGFTATALMIYASAVKVLTAFKTDINDGAAVNKGAGNTNTEIDITDTDADGTNMLHADITNPTDTTTVYGGYATLELISA